MLQWHQWSAWGPPWIIIPTLVYWMKQLSRALSLHSLKWASLTSIRELNVFPQSHLQFILAALTVLTLNLHQMWYGGETMSISMGRCRVETLKQSYSHQCYRSLFGHIPGNLQHEISTVDVTRNGVYFNKLQWHSFISPHFHSKIKRIISPSCYFFFSLVTVELMFSWDT